MRLSLRVFQGLALSLCAFFAAPAIAGNGALDALRYITDEVDFVFVVDDAALIRQTPTGRAVAQSIASMVGPDELARWTAFAAEIGGDADSLFDGIFGRRVMIVGRGTIGLDEADQPEWAVIAYPDKSMARRVRKTLKATPRQILEDRAVFGIEHGKFLITFPKEDDRFLIASSRSWELFRDLAAGLDRKPERALSDERAFEALRKEAGQPAFTLGLRVPDSGWFALAGRVKRDIVTADIALTTDMPMAEARPWSSQFVGDIGSDALVCITERIPEKAFADMEWRTLVPPLMRTFITDARDDGVLGDRYLLQLSRSEGGGVAITLGWEARDLESMAIIGDEFASDQLLKFSTLLNVGAWEYDYGGEEYEAMRYQRLTEPDGRRFSFIGGDGFGLAWTYRHSKALTDNGGWFIGGTEKERVRALAESTSGESARGNQADWLSVGFIRPNALLQAMEERDEAAGLFDFLGVVEKAMWRIERTGPYEAQGDARMVILDD